MKEDNAKTGYDEWMASLGDMSFEESSAVIRDKILESPELDDESRGVFSDAFEYVSELQSAGKPLDTNLMRIRLTEMRGHGNIDAESFLRILMMLSLCGFRFGFEGPASSGKR